MITVFPSEIQEIIWGRSNVIVAQADGLGHIIFATDRANQLYGYLPGELLGKSIDELLPQNKTTEHRDHRIRFNKHPVERAMGERIPLQGRRKDGTLFSVRIHLIPCFVRPGTPVTIAIVYPMQEGADITPPSGVHRLEDTKK